MANKVDKKFFLVTVQVITLHFPLKIVFMSNFFLIWREVIHPPSQQIAKIFIITSSYIMMYNHV